MGWERGWLGGEVVGSGCYIKMFTGLAQCGTQLRSSMRTHVETKKLVIRRSGHTEDQRTSKEKMLDRPNHVCDVVKHPD